MTEHTPQIESNSNSTETPVEERYAVHVDDYHHYETAKLRRHFLIEQVFGDNCVRWVYTHYERMMVGGVIPRGQTVALLPIAQQKSDHFLARRELGIINTGGAGSVSVDGERYALAHREALYVGSTHRDVVFGSDSADKPAKFYLNSTPAHQAYPIKKVGMGDANVLNLGSAENCNERRINQLLISSVVQTCQLQMGMTELQPGSIWNTLPMHTHSRRMEAYFYFNIPEDQAVCHFMGPPDETRHLWIANEQAVVSPPWSVHSGVGTANYTFIWGMAGENLDYTDMDFHPPQGIR